MGGRWVVVASVKISATEHFQFVAESIAIFVIQAIAIAVEVLLGVNAVAPVVRGLFVVVASCDIHTTRDLSLIHISEPTRRS